MNILRFEKTTTKWIYRLLLEMRSKKKKTFENFAKKSSIRHNCVGDGWRGVVMAWYGKCKTRQTKPRQCRVWDDRINWIRWEMKTMPAEFMHSAHYGRRMAEFYFRIGNSVKSNGILAETMHCIRVDCYYFHLMFQYARHNGNISPFWAGFVIVCLRQMAFAMQLNRWCEIRTMAGIHPRFGCGCLSISVRVYVCVAHEQSNIRFAIFK